MTDPILALRPEGLYCAAGNFYIDPWGRVEKALITHAHADHSRWGMGSYLSHRFSVPIIRYRLGGESVVQATEYGERISIGDASVSFHPAGHIPGSAQIRVEVGGEVWVVSGDYKLEDDGLSTPFEPVRCHTFISESTFGLPVFRWRPQSEIFDQINSWWAKNANLGVASVLVGYSLGKAQRMLVHLDRSIGPVHGHGAIAVTTDVLRRAGVALPPLERLTKEVQKSELRRALILIPPSALAGKWLSRFNPHSVGYASGWMAVRGMKRRRGIENGFVLSDHVDWPAMLAAVEATGCTRVLLTHGYTAQGTRWFREQGREADELKTAFEDDDSTAEVENESATDPENPS